jgi:hypothetical protein
MRKWWRESGKYTAIIIVFSLWLMGQWLILNGR